MEEVAKFFATIILLGLGSGLVAGVWLMVYLAWRDR